MKNENVIMLNLDQALHPDIEELYQYDKIFLPMEFKNETNNVIKALYVPLQNVYYYESYSM